MGSMRVNGAVWAGCMGLLLTIPVHGQAPDGTGTQVMRLEDFLTSEEQLMDQAQAFEQAKDPGRALLIYEEVLRYHSQGKRAEEALFRIASCYRQLGRFEEARKTLALRQKHHPTADAPWKAASSLLEAEMSAAEGRWKETRTAARAAFGLTDRAFRLRAHYLAVLAAENLKDLAPERPSLELLARETQDNPHTDYARLKLGALDAAENRPEAAARAFKDVLARTADSALRAEAGVRAGNLAYADGDWREAAANYEVVRKTDAPVFWKHLAHLGLVQSAFAAGDHARLLEIYQQVRPQFPESARSRVLFLVAESTRLAGKNRAALEAYAHFLKEFPDDAMAESAVWARILILRATNDPGLAAETARFLGKYLTSARKPSVQLLRAELFYDKEDFKTAAPMFAELASQTDVWAAFAPEAREGILFRWGRSALGTGNWAGARTAFDRLLRDHPRSSLRSGALWMLGQAALREGDKPAAYQAWMARVAEFPKEPDREQTLWQTILLAGGMEKFSDLRDLLRLHLKEFPASPNTAEAHALLAGALGHLGEEQAARPHWESARRMDPARHYGTSTQQLIRLALLRSDVGSLRTEVEAYDAWRQKNPKAPGIALAVYEWLGQELAGSDKPSDAAAYYRIVLAASRDAAQRQRAQLGLALLMSKLENHGAAIKEWNQFRLDFPAEANRSTVLEPLARAHIGAAQFDRARELAEQILRQNPEGEFNARGRILLGDVAMGQRAYTDAAKYYGTAALLIEDPVLTPRALWRAEKAQRLAGQTAAADALLLELRKRFPDYRE